MARARLLKPGFFLNNDLASLKPHARLLFQGLWLLADRAGRLENNAARIKAQLFPYERVDVSALLDLLSGQFITQYESGGQRFIAINNFKKHQTPHVKEPPSLIPAPDEHQTGTGVAEAISPLTLNHNPIPVAERGHTAPPSAAAAREDNPDWQRAVKAWERQSPGSINPVILDALDLWLGDGYPIEWIEKACEAAGQTGGRKPVAFVLAVLKRYRSQGSTDEKRRQTDAEAQLAAFKAAGGGV